MMMQESSPEDAVHFRRNLLEYDLVPNAAFFMIATQVDLYLWRQQSDPDALPDFSAPVKAVPRRYLRQIADQAGGPDKESLKMTLTVWLDNLAYGIKQPDPMSEADQMLIRSGLFE